MKDRIKELQDKLQILQEGGLNDILNDEQVTDQSEYCADLLQAALLAGNVEIAGKCIGILSKKHFDRADPVQLLINEAEGAIYEKQSGPQFAYEYATNYLIKILSKTHPLLTGAVRGLLQKIESQEIKEVYLFTPGRLAGIKLILSDDVSDQDVKDALNNLQAAAAALTTATHATPATPATPGTTDDAKLCFDAEWAKLKILIQDNKLYQERIGSKQTVSEQEIYKFVQEIDKLRELFSPEVNTSIQAAKGYLDKFQDNQAPEISTIDVRLTAITTRANISIIDTTASRQEERTKVSFTDDKEKDITFLGYTNPTSPVGLGNLTIKSSNRSSEIIQVYKVNAGTTLYFIGEDGNMRAYQDKNAAYIIDPELSKKVVEKSQKSLFVKLEADDLKKLIEKVDEINKKIEGLNRKGDYSTFSEKIKRLTEQRDALAEIIKASGTTGIEYTVVGRSISSNAMIRVVAAFTSTEDKKEKSEQETLQVIEGVQIKLEKEITNNNIKDVREIWLDFCGTGVRADYERVFSDMGQAWEAAGQPNARIYLSTAGAGSRSKRETALAPSALSSMAIKAASCSPSKDQTRGYRWGEGIEEQGDRAAKILDSLLPENKTATPIQVKLIISQHSRGSQAALLALEKIIEVYKKNGYEPQIIELMEDGFQGPRDKHHQDTFTLPKQVIATGAAYCATERAATYNDFYGLARTEAGVIAAEQLRLEDPNTQIIAGIALRIGHDEIADSSADQWDTAEGLARGIVVEEGVVRFKKPEEIRAEALLLVIQTFHEGNPHEEKTKLLNQIVIFGKTQATLLKEFNALKTKKDGETPEAYVKRVRAFEKQVAEHKANHKKLEASLKSLETELRRSKTGINEQGSKDIGLCKTILNPENKYYRDIVKQYFLRFVQIGEQVSEEVNISDTKVKTSDIQTALVKELALIKEQEQTTQKDNRTTHRQGRSFWFFNIPAVFGLKTKQNENSNTPKTISDLESELFSKEKNNTATLVTFLSELQTAVGESAFLRQKQFTHMQQKLEKHQDKFAGGRIASTELAKKPGVFTSRWFSDSKFARRWLHNLTTAELGAEIALERLYKSGANVTLEVLNTAAQASIAVLKGALPKDDSPVKTALEKICNGKGQSIEKLFALQQKARELLADSSPKTPAVSAILKKLESHDVSKTLVFSATAAETSSRLTPN